MTTGNTSSQSYEDAFRHVVAHMTMLRAYLRVIVRDPELTEDVLSDVAVEIARSWERFDRERPFAEWARGIARRVALASLRKRSSQPALLDPEVLDAVGAELDTLGNQAQLEERKVALRECLDKLSGPNRRLVELRYFQNQSYVDISRLLKRSMNALYAAFSRVHGALSDCVKRCLETA